MDSEQIATLVGPLLIGVGMVILAFIAIRPARRAEQTTPLLLDSSDDDAHPGLSEVAHQRLPSGAARVLASLTEVRADPRNQSAISTTHTEPSRVATASGDPDTGVIRVLDRSEVQQPVSPDSVARHPAGPANS